MSSRKPIPADLYIRQFPSVVGKEPVVHALTARMFSKERKARPMLFACVPTPVLKYPPISRHGTAANGLLTVFEFAVAAAILAHAYRASARKRHGHALKAGRLAVQDRQALGAQIAREKRADLEYGPMGSSEYGFRERMSNAYFTATGFYSPADTAVVVSRSALLRAAGLTTNSRNTARVGKALARLRSAVKAGPHRLPPLLLESQALPNGRCRLVVAREWLARPIGVVPLPLPTRGNSSTVLALFLFLFGSDQRGHSTTNSIEPEKLCRRISIAFRWPREACAALDNALEAVNAHLSKNRAALSRAQLPLRFVLVSFKEGTRLRFEAVFLTLNAYRRLLVKDRTREERARAAQRANKGALTRKEGREAPCVTLGRVQSKKHLASRSKPA